MKFSLGKITKTLIASGVVAAMSTGAHAATQGAIGATSTGTLDIIITVLDEVRISNLVDINLGTFIGVDAIGSSPACIYRTGTGAYQITGTGDGVAGAFDLTDGANTVAYSVAFDDGSGPTSLDTGTVLPGQTGADPASDTCAVTGNNATVGVTVAAADAAGLPAATYSGTLTLVVAPE